MFDKIATEAAKLGRINKRPTITSREIQTAVRLVGATGQGSRVRLQGWPLSVALTG